MAIPSRTPAELAQFDLKADQTEIMWPVSRGQIYKLSISGWKQTAAGPQRANIHPAIYEHHLRNQYKAPNDVHTRFPDSAILLTQSIGRSFEVQCIMNSFGENNGGIQAQYALLYELYDATDNLVVAEWPAGTLFAKTTTTATARNPRAILYFQMKG